MREDDDLHPRTIRVEYVTGEPWWLTEPVDVDRAADAPPLTIRYVDAPVLAVFDDSYVVAFNGERMSIPRPYRSNRGPGLWPATVTR